MDKVKSFRIISVVLFLVCINGIIPTHAQSVTGRKSGEWRVHSPGGETSCALGTEFRYYTRKGNTDKLLIHFTGGGGCYNGKLCDPETDPTPYNYREEERDPRNMSGIFDLDHPDNPFSDYTLLVAPTCTGDVALGDSVATYQYQTDNGKEKTVTIHHRGYVNGMATLQWAFQHIPDPGTIVVTGSSAGGVAAPFYANIVANYYPQARVIGIGDGAGALSFKSMPGADYTSWNLKNTARNHEAFSDLDIDNLGVQDLFTAAARQRLSNLELYQVDIAYDNIQRFHLSLGGNKNPDVLKLIQKNREVISSHNPDFRSFLIGGDEHVMLQAARFYFFKSDEKLLVEWIENILAGKNIPSITCSDCRQPGLTYSEKDLEVINNIEGLLSDEQHWNPKDDFRNNRNCAQDSSPYSLRCSVVKAIRLSGGSVGESQIAYKFKYEIKERLKNEKRTNLPGIVQYNNQDGRTFQDILDMIEVIKNDIRNQLQ